MHSSQNISKKLYFITFDLNHLMMHTQDFMKFFRSLFGYQNKAACKFSTCCLLFQGLHFFFHLIWLDYMRIHIVNIANPLPEKLKLLPGNYFCIAEFIHSVMHNPGKNIYPSPINSVANHYIKVSLVSVNF